MANIAITIPDDKVQRILDAFASEFGYSATVLDANGVSTPNPQTKAQFTKQQIVAYIKQIVANNESMNAANTSRNTIINDINSISIT